MTLTMIQLTPDVRLLTRWAHQVGLLPARGEDDLGYTLHAALAAAFGKSEAPKPFALLRPTDRPPQLLGYTSSNADELQERAAAVAEPAAAAALCLEELAAKRMPEAWKSGGRYGFQVRVRPMLRTDRDGDRTRAKEVDAFVLSPPGSSRGEVYTAWLRQRLEAGGVLLEQAHMQSFRLSRVLRRGAPAGGPHRPLRSQEGPDVTFTGILRIRDGALFPNLLARGVGRHRAFGFGMLLLGAPEVS
jgi:CRISPR system Cascade subunit CasE